MGRRPRFCPPLLSNQRIGTVDLARLTAAAAHLTAAAAHHRACLAPEVEEEDMLPPSSSVAPEVEEEDMLPPSSSVAPLPSSSGLGCTDSSRSPRVMQGLRFRSPLSKMLLSPRIRSPSVQRRTSPSVRITEECSSISPIVPSQGRVQRSKKRKSPCATIPVFRSPLSRVLISPRVQIHGAHVRSPLVQDSEVEIGQDTEVGQDSEIGQDTEVGQDSEIGQDTEVGQDSEVEIGQDTEVGQDSEVGQDTEVGQDSEVGQDTEVGQDSEVGQDTEVAGRRRVIVPNETRRAIVEALVARSRRGKLKKNDTRKVSIQFSIPIRTVQRIWHEGRSCLNEGVPVDVRTKKYKCGRKKKDVDISLLKDVPFSSRTTVGDVATHLGVSRSTVHKMKKEGALIRVSSTLKPDLLEQNKKDRLKWCMSMLQPESIPHDPTFKRLFDYVFIDEKWFNITRKTERYYIVPGEELPKRTCKNKNYIPKIMFLTAIARPRFDSDGNCTFDGKIGCFPFVKYEPAKRSSVNRPAGTIEMKAIGSIKKKEMQEFMIEKVLPAIRAKWPAEDARMPIYIQQDNATPHITPTDRVFCEAAKEYGFDIRIVCQPANSPDFNILDLGFFNAIQSIQYKSASKTIEELVATVERAFNDYSVHQANRIFLTLHACLREVMKISGGNGYDVPHIRKGQLERQGCLPLQLKCDPSLVQDVMEQINEQRQSSSHTTDSTEQEEQG